MMHAKDHASTTHEQKRWKWNLYVCVCVFMYVYMYVCISHKSNLTRWGDTAENLELDK